MWPFKKPPPPPIKAKFYWTTALQVGDDCICVEDSPNGTTHQKLLTRGEKYKVRSINLQVNNDGAGGPWIRLEGIYPIDDISWRCIRFEKAVKPPPTAIIKQISEPTEKLSDKEIEKAKEEAY